MKNMNVLILALVMMIGLVLTGCNNTESAESDSTEPAKEEKKGNSGDESSNNESDYPNRDIEIVVGWGAGGGTDTYSRTVAKPMSEILGVNMNVVNKPGSSGAIAGDYTTKQPADGYTIWAISGNYALNVAAGKTPHDLSKYTPIGRVQNDTSTIQVKADSPYADIDTLIEEAKTKPGEISVGGTGAMSFDELQIRALEKAAGVKFNYIPYESAGEMHAALLGGHIDAMIDEVGPTISQIEDGSIAISLVYAEERLNGFEDIPTTVELGWDLTNGQERGFMVHSDTPTKIVKALEKALKEAKQTDGYKEYEKNSYLHLKEGWLNSEDFKAKIQKNIDGYKELF